ncbi:pmp10 [Symbiodinium sp. CCMP2592]|nr:pmp10 [Symbiodinium sp. CCMP2592]
MSAQRAKLALVLCVFGTLSQASRPTRQDDVLSLEGGEESGGTSGPDVTESSMGTLLPKACGGDGIIYLEEGVTYRTEKSNHSIPDNCHTLQGAPSSRILLYAGISFASTTAVIRAPLRITMAPDVETLSSPAIRSTGSLQAVSPKDRVLEFHDISTSATTAALAAANNGSVQLGGEGTMIFENLRSFGAPVADVNFFDVNSTVTHLTVRNVTNERGAGAIYGGRQVHIDSNGTVRFENCTCKGRGAAIASVGQLKLTGDAAFVFEECSSGAATTGSVTGGGALSSLADVMLQLGTKGSAVFRRCWSRGSGGAIYSGGDMNVTGGSISFDGCRAGSGNGHAIAAGHGLLQISELTRVALEGMESYIGSPIFARDAAIPVVGDLLPEDVFELEMLMASKPPSQGDHVCPAGSRFKIDTNGAPILGKCQMCGSGTVSLATSTLEVEGRVAAAEDGMRIVLVRRGSPNAIRPLSDNRSTPERCKGHSFCLGLARGDWAPAWKTFPVILEKHNQLAFTFDRGMFRTEDGWILAVAYDSYAPNTPLAFLKGLNSASWRIQSETGMFTADEYGHISPRQAPDLVFGIVSEVNYTFQPEKNPYLACLPCHDVASEMADKIQCHGATSASSLRGYMLLHVAGKQRLEVHRCPNCMACPGSNLSLTSAGELAARSRLCAEGYQSSPGCIRCEPGYGRHMLDPFVCAPCAGRSLVQQVGMAVVSSGLFYVLALNSAKPQTDTQQIFKVFLAFLTISCRSLSALPNTRHYKRLISDIYAGAQALYQCLFAVDLVISTEPGSMNSSYDCWGLVDGPVNLYWSIFLSWSIPTALLLLSWCWLGKRGWLKALVVWGNMFVPPLIGAAAKLLPCFSTQAEGSRILMYEAAFGTPCVESLSLLLKLPRFWLAAATSLLLLLVGPLLWLALAARDPGKELWEGRRETAAFLVAGYRPTLRWWEVIVLGRKAAVFVVATLLPMSWAPASHLVYLLGIMIVAEILHVTIRPYASPFLNRLEAQMLGISSACLVLVISLIVEWPFMPYAMYVASSALFFALTAGVYIYFLWIYIRSAFAKTSDMGEEDEEADEQS